MAYLEIPSSNYKSKLPPNLVFYFQPTFYHIQNIINILLSLSIFPKEIVNLIGEQLLGMYRYPLETTNLTNIVDRKYDIYPDAYLVKLNKTNILFDISWNNLEEDKSKNEEKWNYQWIKEVSMDPCRIEYFYSLRAVYINIETNKVICEHRFIDYTVYPLYLGIKS